MEVFLSERIIEQEAIAYRGSYAFSVVHYALRNRLRVRWVFELPSLQACFDPWYDFLAKHHVALSYEFTTALLIVIEHSQVIVY